MQMRIFKEFIDMEDNERAAEAKEQEINHQKFRLSQELAAMMVLTRVFYIKLEQEENALNVTLAQKRAIDGIEMSLNC